jgi:plasmid stabilization system protein ParE
MPLPYVIGEDAEAALKRIEEYYSKEFPSAGKRILKDLFAAFDRICEFPTAYEVIERYLPREFRKRLVGERIVIYRIVEIEGVKSILIDQIVLGSWQYDKILDLL